MFLWVWGFPDTSAQFYEHQVMCAVGNLSVSLAFGARGSDNDGSLNAPWKAAAGSGALALQTPCPVPFQEKLWGHEIFPA